MKNAFSVFMVLLIFFFITPTSAQSKKVVQKEMISVAEIFLSDEIEPQYPNGNEYLQNLIERETQYPFQLEQSNIRGKVIVRFIVDENGNVKDPKVITGLNELMNQEALRVVSRLPKFIPGESKGVKVKKYFYVSVNFLLK